MRRVDRRTNALQTDRPTGQPTDTASYRGALSHLKREKEEKSKRINLKKKISFAKWTSGNDARSIKSVRADRALKSVRVDRALYHIFVLGVLQGDLGITVYLR